MTADDVMDVPVEPAESGDVPDVPDVASTEATGSPMSRLASRLVIVGCAVAAVGVFTRWSSGDGVTLNGIQGPHNGWIVLVYLVIGVAVARAVGRGSRTAALTAALVAIVTIVTVLTTASVPGFGMAWGYWLTFVGGAVVVVGAGTAFAARVEQSVHDQPAGSPDDDSEGADPGSDPEPTGRRLRWPTLGEVGLVVAVFFFLVLRQVLGIGEDPSWPPPSDAIPADRAEAATADFAADGLGPHDVGLDYAWSTAATVEPWAEGATFYPKIFDDVAGAETSIHILMFGWKPGDVGDELTSLLVDRLADGVEVRILVDGVGSQPTGASKAMYERLVDAGAVVVVNDTLPFDRDGPLFDRGISTGQREVGRADHRKLYVIDGEVAWTGGAGIEDHFLTGEFYDVMVRVTGDIVRQTQAVFLTSFAAHDAPLPADLSPYFPEPADPGAMPAAVGQVVPGGFVSATQAARELIDSASERLDIMNPYLADRDMIERMIMAAERGVDVRVITSKESNNAPAAWAMKHRYDDLLDAGVEIWEYPGAVVHAKLVVADDRVQFGTLNLDAWALYRNFEVALMVDDAEVADRLIERAIEPAIDRAEPGARQGGFERVRNWIGDKLTYFL